MERCRMVFSGSGGQGVITAAMIAVQSQTYGPAARGGSTRSDVIISDSNINFPKVLQPNVLVCLTQEAYNLFYPIIRPGGLLITDTRFVKTEKKVDAQQREFPMYRTVLDKIGKPIVFNICMLGVVLSLTDLVKSESIIKVLESRIPSSFLEMNRKALNLGMELAEESKD
ncbi:MAG: 2-oxoacid:acceptor oxidoreductase family protein [Deltaproteobacteria bacterium]|nr:2-oxoacid:acceptor oxidoreductase family protein [Deltaproteobacteria bacterium]